MSADTFFDTLEGKAKKAISDYGMILQGDKLIAGVSGGADSVSLLHFLLNNGQEFDIRVSAVHINHNLRGEESRRDEAFVKDICEKLNVPLIIESVDVAASAVETGKSIEESARNERYRVFTEIAAATGAKIATAHTLDDSVETQLINLSRGTGPRGLLGIPPVRDNIIRPLIGCTRQDIEAYCNKHSLSFITDSSNLSDIYTRNRIRHKVIPVLREENSAFLSNASKTMELLRADAEYLDTQADTLFKELSSPSGLDRGKLLALPFSMSSRILLALCAQSKIPPEYARIEMMMDAARNCGQLQLSASKMLICRKSTVFIHELTEAIPYFETEVDTASLSKSSCFEIYQGKTINLTRLNRKEFENNTKTEENLLKNVMDCDRIGKIIKIRQRLPADFIRLNGRGCSKTLKKLFNESKIPSGLRNGIAVISGDPHGLIWVEGFGVSEECAVTDSTKNMIIAGTETIDH